MKNKREEDDLRDLFKQLGSQSEHQGRAFTTVWEDAQSKKQRKKQRKGYLILSIAASAALLFGSVLMVRLFIDSSTEVDAGMTLSKWKSPTEMLLQSSLPSSFSITSTLPTDALIKYSKTTLMQEAAKEGELN